jgi:T4 RnlA family RNA ligase
MKTIFEYADNITDYLQAIKDCPEFVVVEKPGGITIINYNVMLPTTFPDPATATSPQERRNFILRRDCRGLVFDTATGEILHKRLHKFFNVNENDEMHFSKLDLTEPHIILEKLDGSLISSLWTQHGLRWGTKMGETDVAAVASEFVKNHPQYENFAYECHDSGLTPLFEWCSRKSKIVLDYPNDQLVLIAIRCNLSGNYISYKKMVAYGNKYKIPVVKAFQGTAHNMQSLVDSVKDMQGIEGFVVRFESGQMVKIKSSEYVALHKAKDAISLEKNVISVLINNQVDDLKPLLNPSDLSRLLKFEHDFWFGISGTVRELIDLRESCTFIERKEYAVNFVQQQDKKMQTLLYAMFDFNPQSVLQLVKDTIVKNCHSQTQIDHCRWLWGNHKWYEN